MSYPISEKLLSLLEKELALCEGNNAALARKIGIDPSYLYKYMRGTVKSVHADTWIKLCNFFPEIDPGSLFLCGNAIPAQPLESYFPVVASDIIADKSRQFYIPLGEYAKNNPQSHCYFPEGEEGDFAVSVVGEQMQPWYPPGCILLARPNARLYNWDPVLAITHSGTIHFRIFFEGKSKITLASLDDNPANNIQFDKDDSPPLRLVLKIIQSMRNEAKLLKQLRKHKYLEYLEKYEQA
ncbi:MAG: helix-turn-helix domain-containing protein [Lentisphaerae bacterium]|nr:helix-turn-helix domain-containing protein [Lentisphaerota bacterium]